MNKKRLLYIILIGILFFICMSNLLKPFPFINMSYTRDITQFNCSPEQMQIDLNISLTAKKIADMKKYVYLFKNDNYQNDLDDIHAMVYATRAILHTSRGIDLRRINNILSTDKNFLRICSEASKIFMTLSQAMGYYSRVLWINGHVVFEIYIHKKWVLVDSFGNIMFKNKKTKDYVSLLDVLVHYKKVYPEQIVKRKYNDMTDYIDSKYLQKDINVYNQQDLVVVLENTKIFQFHRKTHEIENIVKFMFLGESSISSGIQFLLPNSSKVGNCGISIYKKWSK